MENVHRGFCNVLCFFAVLRFELLRVSAGFHHRCALQRATACGPSHCQTHTLVRLSLDAQSEGARHSCVEDIVILSMYIRWVCPKTALPESLKIGYPQNLLIIHFPCQNCQPCYRFGLISTFSDTPRGWWQVVCARISQIGTTACRDLGSQDWKNTGDFMIYHHSIVIDTPSLCHVFSRTLWILIDHGDCFGFSTPFTSPWVSHGFGLNHLV